MSLSRRCTKTACRQPAVATLTYAYSDRAVVVGPLATFAEPHSYDLCADHAGKLTPPRGWDIVRLSQEGYVVVTDTDDLLAVVEAVRETPRRVAAPAHATPAHTAPRAVAAPGSLDRGAPPSGAPTSAPTGRVRGHLRVFEGDGETHA